VKAGEVDEAEEVLDVVFPSGDESAEAVHPGEESLAPLRAFSVSGQPAPVVAPVPVAPVGRDHLDAAFLLEPSVERIRVVGLVADEPCGEFVEEASGQTYSTGWHSAGEALSRATGEEIVLPSRDQFPSPRRQR
jgi:hypothetical protein